jgi:hypothetical protein
MHRAVRVVAVLALAAMLPMYDGRPGVDAIELVDRAVEALDRGIRL